MNVGEDFSMLRDFLLEFVVENAEAAKPNAPRLVDSDSADDFELKEG